MGSDPNETMEGVIEALSTIAKLNGGTIQSRDVQLMLDLVAGRFANDLFPGSVRLSLKHGS